MTPEEVPDGLVRAAYNEMQRADREFPVQTIELAREVLAAVLPLHEQQVREQIAGSLWQLPIVQHLGIYGSHPDVHHMVVTAEAALRYVLTLVLHPDQIPERLPR